MAPKPQEAAPKMWVMGKYGWYCADLIWNDGLAEHWRGMGFRVERSVGKPEAV